MSPCPRNTEVSAPPTRGKAKCTVSGTRPPPQRRPGGAQGAQHGVRTSWAPGQQQGQRESPGLGPVGTSVRSSLQGGTSLIWLHAAQGGQGAGQAYQDGGWKRWVWVPQGQVLENATMAGLEPLCPNHGLTKAGEGNREGAGG